MKFYENLEKILKTRNITIYKMCKDLGISNTTIGNYKNGTIPKIDIVDKISLYLGISNDVLIRENDIETFDTKLLAAYHAAEPGTQKSVLKLLDVELDAEPSSNLYTSKIG